MHTYVFVYSQSRFKVGDHPLVRFEVGGTYREDMPAISRGTEGVVDRGIYVISADAADMEPEISAVEGRSTVDYDLFLVRGKDPWPTLTDPSAMSDRVRATFPAVRDEDLRRFLVALGV